MTFKYKNGALTCDEEIVINGNVITQDMSFSGRYEESLEFYGNRYFLCETITKLAAREVALGIVSQLIYFSPLRCFPISDQMKIYQFLVEE